MRVSQYDATLSRLYRWSLQASAAVADCKSLAEKVAMRRFERDIETARRLLRVHVFDAEDLATITESHRAEGETDDAPSIDTPIGPLQLERAKL